jgi:hypothetical protein
MKQMLSEDSTVAVVAGQVSSDLGGEVAILNLEAGMYYGLDDVGARVWELAQEPTAVRSIQDKILEEYEVDPDQGRREVFELLAELVEEGLLEVRD